MSEEKDEKSIQDYISESSPDEVTPAVAEETKEAEQVETPEPDQQEVEEDETSGLSEGLKKRFSKLTADKHRLKSAAEEAERKAAELEAKLQSYEQKGPERPVKPTLEQFDWDEPKFEEAKDKYFEDLADWKAQQRLGEYEQRGAVDKIQQKKQTLAQQHAERVQKSGIENYDEKLDGLINEFAKAKVPIYDHFVESIQLDENGPRIVEFFSSNPKRAAEVAQMGVVQAALEIGKISAKIAAGKPLQKSNAPPPVKPVKGSGVKPKDTDSFSVHDWVHGDLKEIGINDR